MAFCLDPDAHISFFRAVAAAEALGVPRVKAVQAVSELLHSGELEKEVDLENMGILIRMGTKAVSVEEANP